MVSTRSQAKKRRTLSFDLYDDLVERVPGIGRTIEDYVGPIRNGYTAEQLISPALLRKQLAVLAVNDWYDGELHIDDVFNAFDADHMIVLLAFRIYCYMIYQG